jgi:hypothetical protein
VNELVILTIHLAEVTEDVIEVLAIDILPLFSNRRHNHVEEIRTCALRKMAEKIKLLIKIKVFCKFHKWKMGVCGN